MHEKGADALLYTMLLYLVRNTSSFMHHVHCCHSKRINHVFEVEISKSVWLIEVYLVVLLKFADLKGQFRYTCM